ncbi:MAG: ATP-dependent Clp protease ATP-binding subunit [Spirochaetales bacterium]|nr:ATP-dependent Clp protease ATP-binding subunit [Spirochaetales bacterium]
MSRYDKYSDEAVDVLLAVQDLAAAARRPETGLDELSRALAVAAVPELLEIAGSNGAYLDRERLKAAFDEFLATPPTGGDPVTAASGAQGILEFQDPLATAETDAERPGAPPDTDGAAESGAAPVVRIPRLRIAGELRAVLDDAERLAGDAPVAPVHLVRAAWPAVRERLEPFFSRDEGFATPLSLPYEQPEEDMLGELLSRLGKELGDEGDPCIGREAEIEALASALLRWGTSNALLVGPSGVGKTAIVRALAARIARGEVPEPLKGLHIVEVRAGDLAAGTGFHGALEEKVALLVAAVEARPGTVLFIDEIHQISGSYGNDQTADLLKPALSSRGFRLIGATTDSEYRRFMEREEALLRRFQVIRVREPDKRTVREILSALAPRLEAHFGLSLPPPVLELALRLSERYMPERAFPDKAIDLLDRAAARALFRFLPAVPAPPAPEGPPISSPAGGDTGEEASRPPSSSAEGSGRPLPPLPPLPSRVLVETLEELAGVRLDETAADPVALEGLEDRLRSRVYGQDAAVDRVAELVRVAKLRLGSRPGRPEGAFLFTGPTGVGKTELALALARELSGREDALLRVDMGEFSEGHSVSRLLGSPPGYVGYGEGAVLARAAEGRIAVLLLDEIEKAHPQVHRLFLRLLDTGKATDSTGRELDFSNLSVIATSNIGDWSTDPIGFASVRGIDARVPEAALKRAFPPEFLGRFDAVVPFRPLDRGDCARILSGLLVPRASGRLVEERGVSLELDAALLEAVTERGYDPATGARGLERAFQASVAIPLAATLPACKGPGRLLGRLGPDGRATFEFVPEGGLYRGGDAG